MFHELTIIGNLGRDPEMRYTPSGQAVTNMTVASNRKYTNNQGEQVSEVVWFNISVWGKQAEACNTYLHKGSKVFIKGRLTPDKSTGRPRIWSDKQGEPGSSYDVTAETVRFLDGKQSDSTMTDAAQEMGGIEQPINTDEIPF